MTAPIDLYPLSTADGKAIPLDVVSPTGFLLLNFTTSASAAISLPDTTDILSLSATEDCFVRFANSSAVVPASGTVEDDLFFVDKRMQSIVYPTKKFISVIGSVGGTLRIQFLDAWHGLAIASQFTNR